jgi:ATP adenylyltransferase
MPATQFVDLDNARLDEQRQVMEQIVAAGHCPFCLENFRQYHKLPILKEGKYWLLTQNQWPYVHTKHHFLLILKEHQEELAELDPAAGQELIELSQWAVKEYQLPGGALALRFGDTNYSAGTVKHLHGQLIQPDILAADYADKPVKFKIGKVLEKN